MEKESPILMTEAVWKNSPLSTARFYGRCKYNGYEYWIVNKEGKDLFQCTHEANKRGNSMAIMPGEPADMVRKDFLPFYRKLGRDKFIEVLRFYPHAADKELKEHYRNLVNEKKTAATAVKEPELFT